MEKNMVEIGLGECGGGSIKMMVKQWGGTDEKSVMVVGELFWMGGVEKVEGKEGRVNGYEWLKRYVNE